LSHTLPPVNSVQASRRKLLLIAAVVLTTAATLPMIGFYMRDQLLMKAGPVKVEVRNEASERLRADIYAMGKSYTLEMDPKEHGLIRFNPNEPMEVTVRVFKRNVATFQTVESNLLPHQDQHLTFRLLGPTDVKVERTVAGQPSPQG